MFDSDYVLPVADTEIDVRTLSTVFNNTTGTYKFYWFLSLLDLVCEHNLSRFSDREIVAQMVANAWYPRVYFRLSFGFQETLASVIDELYGLGIKKQIDKHSGAIANFLLESEYLTPQMCKSLTRHVPTRFLNPWFHNKSDLEIRVLSQSCDQCLYAILKNRSGWIYEVNPRWLGYLRKHYKVLSDFTK